MKSFFPIRSFFHFFLVCVQLGINEVKYCCCVPGITLKNTRGGVGCHDSTYYAEKVWLFGLFWCWSKSWRFALASQKGRGSCFWSFLFVWIDKKLFYRSIHVWSLSGTLLVWYCKLEESNLARRGAVRYCVCFDNGTAVILAKVFPLFVLTVCSSIVVLMNSLTAELWRILIIHCWGYFTAYYEALLGFGQPSWIVVRLPGTIFEDFVLKIWWITSELLYHI